MLNMNKTGSFRSHQTCNSNDQCILWYSFMNFLLLFLHRSIQTVKFLLKSLNLCKFTAWCPDVLADKPHPRFDMKILSKKVRLIRQCLQYISITIIIILNSILFYYILLYYIK